ncbi:MAG: fused MFS/spermidine synthase [Bacteroidota bacterium]
MVNIPRWKYWLSYLWSQTIEVRESEHNAYLEVCLIEGRLQLVAEDAIYSFGDYYLNFRKTFNRFKFIELPEKAEVLVLGLGLGSVPELLVNFWELDYSITAVEIDPVIVELATKYSLPHLNAPIEVINADALYFMQLDSRKYDLICMDVFQDATIPTAFETQDFLQLLKESLRPGGALIYNRLASTLQDRSNSKTFLIDHFIPVFPHGGYLNTGGNYMLINDEKFIHWEDEKDLP